MEVKWLVALVVAAVALTAVVVISLVDVEEPFHIEYADGTIETIEVFGERSGSRNRAFVGVWQGEVEPAYFKFCFREDGTGFMTAGNWAGTETIEFSWQDIGGRLSFQGRNIGGRGQNRVDWKYEWMGDNLIIHLIEESTVLPVILSRIPATTNR